jgi:uncharacterized protein YdaU (DUF1376 family)
MPRRNGEPKTLAYWPMFARDWLLDDDVLLMSAAARGIYVQLLNRQWTLAGKGLPDDLAGLVVLADTTEDEFAKAWPMVEPCFPVGEDGRRHNPRMVKEWAIACGLHARKASGGGGKTPDTYRTRTGHRADSGTDSERSRTGHRADSERTPGGDSDTDTDSTKVEREGHTPAAGAAAPKGADSHTPKRKSFAAPSIEDVRAYITERGYAVDADVWHAHYTANGWRVGRNPMKDWQAAVRTWARHDAPGGTGRARPLAFSEVEEAAAKERREREAAKARAQLESQRRADAEGERRRREAQASNARDAADLARALADRAALSRYEAEALPDRSPLLQMAWGANGPTNTAAQADYLAWWRAQTSLSPQMGAGGLSMGGEAAETRQSGPRGGLAGNETTTGKGE